MALEIPRKPINLITEAVNPTQAQYNDVQLTASAIFYTVLAAALSGFLGGLRGIRGPPIILYMLHPTAPVVLQIEF